MDFRDLIQCDLLRFRSSGVVLCRRGGYQEISSDEADQALGGGQISCAFCVVYKNGVVVQCTRIAAAGTFLDVSTMSLFFFVLLAPTYTHEVIIARHCCHLLESACYSWH